MPKRLTLMRHAKSSWDDFSISDFDRTLAPRGVKAAPRMGHYLTTEGLVPELVVSSPSRRTKETLSRLQTAISDPLTIEFDQQIYSAGMGEGVLRRLALVDPDIDHVLVLGHNPSMQELALSLTGWGQSDPDIYQRVLRKFSTAAIASIVFECDDWSELSELRGQMTHFMTPKMLDPKL